MRRRRRNVPISETREYFPKRRGTLMSAVVGFRSRGKRSSFPTYWIVCIRGVHVRTEVVEKRRVRANANALRDDFGDIPN